MSSVSNHLRALIARQVDEHGLVVWFDPERHYEELAREIELPNTRVARYEGSFFALRHAVEPLLDDEAPPRLVVYVPLAEEATDQALIELTAAGVVLKPGQHPMQRNTRLSVIVRHALRDKLGEDRADELAKQVEAGKLALSDLDDLEANATGSVVLQALFGTGDPQTVALTLLSSSKHDAQIEARGATAEVAQALATAFDLELPQTVTLTDLRARLAQQILATEFLASLAAPVPRELATIHTATSPIARQACIEVARAWRLRRDLRASYAEHAGNVETALGLSDLSFPIDQIRDCETFERVECALQEGVEAALLVKPDPKLVELARARHSSYWAEQKPALQARWALIATAGLLLDEARRIEQALKNAPTDPAAFVRAYADGDRPWCLLDTYHRNLERRWHTFEFDDAARQQSLDRLVTSARQRYMDVGDQLADRFVRTLANSHFALDALPHQRQVFVTQVAPALKTGKVAYVLVDALRFEMARELAQSLAEDYEVALTAAIGTVPTITAIGMAALLPGAEANPRIVPVGEGKLGLEIGGTVLKDRRSRLDWLASQHGGRTVIAALEEILPKPKPALHEELRSADLIVVTSPEIDVLAESGNVRLARKAMDDILPELSRLANRLRDYACGRIVLAADHGFLFGDEIDSAMKIDPPGGQTIDLHRRVWVGRGGAADPAYLRAPLAAFGLGDDLEIAVPWGFGAFKSPGGARAYFHGGLAPQELVVPVIVLTPIASARLTPPKTTQWTLVPGSEKISTRFFSVQILGTGTGIFGLEPPRVRVEARLRQRVISTPVAASYGFVEATGDVDLRAAESNSQAIDPNTVTLMIDDDVKKGTVSIHLIDAATGRELAQLDKIELALLAL